MILLLAFVVPAVLPRRFNGSELERATKIPRNGELTYSSTMGAEDNVPVNCSDPLKNCSTR
jgi:hypothetical protein